MVRIKILNLTNKYRTHINMIKKVFPYRMELFLICQTILLFGSIIIPTFIFETIISPLLYILMVTIGIVIISKNKIFFRLFTVLLLGLTVINLIKYRSLGDVKVNELVEMAILFPFFTIVTYEMIKQVWQATIVNKTVILGLISGFISLGIIGALLYSNIEMIHPGSFSGFTEADGGGDVNSNLMYFSFITLMAVGYGDILPMTMLAKKASILIGLSGQLYLVIIMAVVVAKYIQNIEKNKE